ncbi:MAG TPA: AbrB/MazE/SpoVT family DNA-binding domain-containing protein [Blastocatellia bacterium]|nr:AbrB/MazE/SpoVT family DNA-binding domain-containing protein [Blastocatellia bacterium]
MRTRIQKFGNDLALCIPPDFALEAQLKQDSLVEVSVIDKRLVIQPVNESVPTLEELLSAVTEQNIHQEVDFGAATGKEAW